VTGYDMPMFGLQRAADIPLPADCIKMQGGHVHNVPSIVSWLNLRPNGGVDYGGYSQRMEYFGSSDLAAAFFPRLEVDVPEFGPDHLVINVRGAEILRGAHPDYMPIPISFYEEVIAESNLNPVFIGQLGDDDYSRELRRRFPLATFLESGGPAHDFELLRRAANLVIAVSTFSWMAAWLSRAARIVHMPVLGFFNPEQRPDIDVMPKDDARYRFHKFPIRKWKATAEDMAYTLA